MTALLVSSFAAALALGMAWRGYRRGALATLVAWLPALGAGVVLLIAARLVWTWPQHFGRVCLIGTAAALLVYVAARLFLRAPGRARRKRPGDTETKPAPLKWYDRALGAALGVVHAAVICLAISFLGSTISFAVSFVPAKPPSEPPYPHWINTLREGCSQMAHLANFGVLSHIPGLREQSREVLALITVLNAPPEKLRLIAEKRRFADLANVPEVMEAVNDPEYARLIADIGNGDLSALPKAANHPITKRLLESPQLQALIKNLRPSDLAAELKALPDAEPKRPLPADNPRQANAQ